MHPSPWEHRFHHWPFVVVGAGLTGLTAARHLAQRGHRVLVLERGLVPAGASTRNAGFACFGSVGELTDDLDTLGPDATASLVERRWRGLQALRQTFGEAALGWDPSGGHEALRPDQAPLLEQIAPLNALLQPIFGQPVFQHRAEGPAHLGLSPTHFAHLVHNRFEAGLDTGALVDAQLAATRAAGVTLWTGATVHQLDPEPHGVTLDLGSLTLHAERVLVCTNGLTEGLLPLGIRPARGQVLLTEPVEGLALRGVLHFDAGYHYARALQGRVLLGGGRHLHVEEETTPAFGLHTGLQEHLTHLLHDQLLPGRTVAIAARWSGIMGLGPTREPRVERLSDRLGVAVGLGGMGVALSSLVGAKAAALWDDGATAR